MRREVFDAIKAARGGTAYIPAEVHLVDDLLDTLGVPRDGGGRLGTLSMRYETGFAPGDEGKAAGKVSSGAGDPGGKSYGAYQLASLKGQVAAFLKADGAPWAAELSGPNPALPGAFEQRWKAIAAREPLRFFDAQHAYIEKTHYGPVANHARSGGLAIDAMPKAVRDAIWSIGVQHGGAKKIVSDAIQRLAGNREPARVVNALYDARLAYIKGVSLETRTRTSLETRYRDERADALRMLAA